MEMLFLFISCNRFGVKALQGEISTLFLGEFDGVSLKRAIGQQLG